MTYVIQALRRPFPHEGDDLKRTLGKYEIKLSKIEYFGVWKDADLRAPLEQVPDIMKAMKEYAIAKAKAAGEENPQFDDDEFEPDWYELEFRFTKVKEERRVWAEMLLAIYAINQPSWSDPAYLEGYGQAVTYIYRNGYGKMPEPWGKRRRRKTKLISFLNVGIDLDIGKHIREFVRSL